MPALDLALGLWMTGSTAQATERLWSKDAMSRTEVASL